ncbi:MAG: ribose-phosphate pyrophosphokinase [Prevotellaceae bacterium]|jgi:ribose-phosphate pyrophosphokinase|nr:ribose-phosphate pyrophosphokinase [Prevotellaceae bacterium]
MHLNNQIKFFSGRGSRYLAELIAKSFGAELGSSSVLEFSDGEFQASYDESVRGATVFIIQSTFPPSDNLMELLLMIDAARRASAYKIVAVMPYFGWARQDRKDKPRVSIGAKLVADMLGTAGVDRIMTIDLHADQIQGFFSVPVDHIFASSIFLPYIQKLDVENLAIAAPDMGGAKRASAYAKALDCPVIICHKSREKANVVSDMTAIGDVKGKNIIILDDMIDTAGTITLAANMMTEQKALSVRAIATHALFSGPACERIAQSSLEEVIITDTIPLNLNKNHKLCENKIKILSVADLFADVIEKVYTYKSISSTFVM